MNIDSKYDIIQVTGMFEVIFYETEKGKSELWDFLEGLRIKADYLRRKGRLNYEDLAGL